MAREHGIGKDSVHSLLSAHSLAATITIAERRHPRRHVSSERN
jgi:hypothetical protein